MPIPSNRPYFPPHPMDRRADAPERELDALGLGAHWTTHGLMLQAKYLAEYSRNRPHQAAWLLALAACTANDDSTSEDLGRALDRGVSLEDACRIALVANAGRAVTALADKGVDWSSQRIIPPQPAYAGDHQSTTQPNPALVEQFLDPHRAAGVYGVGVTPRLAVELAIEQNPYEWARPDAFLASVFPAIVKPDTPLRSEALGLAGGHARFLSVAIANQAWLLVDQSLGMGLDKDTLDEALLACAMTYASADSRQASDQLMTLASRLLEMGADRDRPFEFNRAAYEVVSAEPPSPTISRPATARQWFTYGALYSDEIDLPAFHSTACPLPLPALPSMDWGQWAVLVQDSHNSHGGDKPTHRQSLLTYLLDADPVDRSTFEAILGFAADHAAGRQDFQILDALLDTAQFKTLEGAMPPQEFIRFLSRIMGAPTEKNFIEHAPNRRAAKQLWYHPRLDRLAGLLPEEDRPSFRAHLEPFLRELSHTQARSVFAATVPGDLAAPMMQASAKPAVGQEEATRLAFTNFLSGFLAGLPPARPRPRRTL